MGLKKYIRKRLMRWLGIEDPKPCVFYTKDFFKNKKFEIGEFTYGIPNVLFENETSNLFIGKYCSIAENVTIFLGGNHRIDWVSTYPFNALQNIYPGAIGIEGHPATKGNVVIGNDVWLGRGATIMSGVTIADGAVVAAGAVITKNIGPYEVWAGNPAKLLKKRFKDEEIIALLKLKWWSWTPEKVNENIHFLQSSELKDFILR